MKTNKGMGKEQASKMRCKIRVTTGEQEWKAGAVKRRFCGR